MGEAETINEVGGRGRKRESNEDEGIIKEEEASEYCSDESSDFSIGYDSDDPAFEILEGKPDGKIWKQYYKEWEESEEGDNKRYVFEEIVNVNASYAAPAGTWYYFTFDARDTTVDATAADAIRTFQANVWHGLFDGTAEVSLCRLKKILVTEDKKKKKKKKKSRHNGKQEVEQDKPSLVESLDSGLVIEELSKGKPRGRKAFVGFKVAVRYTGKLMENDKIFYNNMGEGGEPFEFRLAAGETIKGFEIGVDGMRVGDKRRITIPPDLGYGDQGHGGVIPPDSWLVIEVELMSVGACT